MHVCVWGGGVCSQVEVTQIWPFLASFLTQKPLLPLWGVASTLGLNMSCVARGSVSPAWLGSCIGWFFLCPQTTHTSLVFALAPSISGISEHLSLSPQSSLLWKVKKELILGRRLLLASCRGPAGLSNQKRQRAPICDGRDGKTLNNKEEKGQEKVGCTERAVILV